MTRLAGSIDIASTEKADVALGVAIGCLVVTAIAVFFDWLWGRS